VAYFVVYSVALLCDQTRLFICVYQRLKNCPDLPSRLCGRFAMVTTAIASPVTMNPAYWDVSHDVPPFATRARIFYTGRRFAYFGNIAREFG
jgi:hypothetical protein